MKLTEAEKKELDALRAKAADQTEADKTRIAELEAIENSPEPKVYSEDYVKALRAESAKYRTKLRDTETNLASFDGLTPEQVKEMRDSIKDADTKKLEAKGEWDKLRVQLVAEHDKELGKKDTVHTELQNRVSQLEAEINALVLTNEVRTQASVAEAINPELVEMVIKGRTKVERTEEGIRMIKIMGPDGKERIDPKTGALFTITQLILEMKQEQAYAHLFKGGQTGAGSSTANIDGKMTGNPWAEASLNLTQQGKIIRENKANARRLILEAGKSPATYGL